MASDVVLFSGGMDSLIAWEYLNRPDRLYVELFHKYQTEERYSIFDMNLPGTMTIMEAPFIGRFEKQDADIPLRNMYLVMMAANLGYSNIWVVVQKDEMSIPDRTPTFFSLASITLTYLMGRQIIVSTPFEKMDKSDMVNIH
jgi:7-cyano-7-deazaguanine synthase in queuosine biosynthesis